MTALSLILVIISFGGQDPGGNLPEIIATGIEENYAKIKCFKSTMVCQVVNHQIKKNETKEVKQKDGGLLKQFLIAKEEVKIVFSCKGEYVKADTFKNEIHQKSLSKLKDVCVQYLPASYLEKPRGTAWVKSEKEMANMGFGDPRSWGLSDVSESFPKIIRSQGVTVVKKGVGKEDQNLIKLLIERQNNNIEVTFDSNKSFLPVQIDYINKNQKYYRFIKIEYKLHNEKIWFPSHFVDKTSKTGYDSLKDLEDSKTDLLRTVNSKVNELIINNFQKIEIKKDLLDLPKGTHVIDSILGKDYILGDENEGR